MCTLAPNGLLQSIKYILTKQLKNGCSASEQKHPQVSTDQKTFTVSCNTAKPEQINDKNCRRNGNITVFYSVNVGLTSVFPQKPAMMHKLDKYDIKAALCHLANT